MQKQSSSGQKVDSGKAKALEAALAHIDKEYGKGSVMTLGEQTHLNIEVISTGSISVDSALGVGGLPRGRVIEIFGPESSGKTTFTLHVVAQAQKLGGTCAFIDAEHAMDPAYASKIGVDINKLIVSQPDFGEQALDIAEVLIRSNAIDVLIIDSVAALVPKAELEGDMGDAHVGLQARLMSQALRKLTPAVHKSKTILIFINQIRQKIGGLPFANNETTSGGNALKFYASVRLDIRRIATLKRGDKPFGNQVSVKVVKNKVAPPFKKVEISILFDKGISKELDVLDNALKYSIIEQSGAWLSFNGEKIAQGRDNCLQKMEQDSAFFDKIYAVVLDKIKHQKEDGKSL
jgi:recombination protein RecA